VLGLQPAIPLALCCGGSPPMAGDKQVLRRLSTKSTASLAKNRALVFVKPHAVTDVVKDFVRKQLEAKQVVITQEGSIDAAAIEKGLLVDKHFYAIASRATLLKPEKLLVPEQEFKATFGVEWADVLKSGAALNARDACKRFQVDAAVLGSMWNKAKEDGHFAKFGSGFYCAKIERPGTSAAFVFNGFFMEMREKYVAPGASIHYFLAEWSPVDLSWLDFRAKLLGPTDPSTAPSDSIRGTLFAEWQSFGLNRQPDISDNGVHASASPMEALFERMNWLGVKMEEDPFGEILLEKDVTPELIAKWHRDPQVSYGRGSAKVTGSLCAALEDLDVDRCVTRCLDIARTGRTHVTVHNNRAFVFIKPHAVTRAVKNLVRQVFEDLHMRVMQEGVVEAEQIDEGMLVDRQYYAIASKATLLAPDEQPVPAEKFKDKFGVEWADALGDGSVLNARDACDKLGLTPAELETAWNESKEAGGLVKFAGGFYCAKIAVPTKGTFYVLNGFFMAMRNKFVRPGAQIHYFVVDWDPVQLSWADFRSKVLGPTDPATAPVDSIRGAIFRDWRTLGLDSEPNIGDNGVHASASPMEALFERMNWLDVRLERDPFGKLLLQGSISSEQVEEWSKDPQVTYGFGPTKGSLYDCLEDKDTDACLEESLVIARAGHTPVVVRNSAVVFIKPHAITEATKGLVKDHLISKGLHVAKEGLIDAATIDKQQLIDKHYYAIASKATLQNPDQLTVPEDRFERQFGVKWSDALETGNVLNAKQACERYKLDGATLGAKWAEAKKAGEFVKFGGGFYCARLHVVSEADGRCTCYVFNGFFMEMRSKYVAPGAAIYYYLVEWDPLDLSWADFRSQVLGSTDPAVAPEDSLRGVLLARWRELGLASEPDIGDNGVHASASPFEALCERMNWLSVRVEEDAFGQLLLHGGVTPEHVKAWALDPQVTFISCQQPTTCSLYDALEDLDADRCVTQCQLIVGDEAGPCESLPGERAEQLRKRGRVLGTSCVDSYSAYTFKYFVEDVENPGPIWEITRDLMKKDDGEYEEQPIWSGRKLTFAEAQQVLSSSAPRRSPLSNRLPTSP